MALAVGTRLGSYEILAPLGAGGMGEVYRARDTKLDREVAIKVLPERIASDPDALARFEREAKAVAALSHPNILAIHDFGVSHGTAYAVMELLDGESLRVRLAQGALGVRKATEIGAQIARGLASAHERGIVHRDLKPDNVFLTRDGQVKILDFGLARHRSPSKGDDTDSPTLSRYTDPGTVMGTVGYMSPEQVRGRPVDHRSDIFAFGVVLYEMLSGRRAFKGDSAVETMNAILKEEPPELPASVLGALPAVDRLVTHCLEKDPARRHQSAQDLAFDLDGMAGSSGSMPPAAGPPGVSRRHWLGFATSAVAGGAATAGGLTAAGWRSQRPDWTSQRLTFRRGSIYNARFASDRMTVVYSATFEGPPQVYTTRIGSQESAPRDLGGPAWLFSVSSRDELAIGLGESSAPWTLARAPLATGAPKPILDNVRLADFASDGETLAVGLVSEPEAFGTPGLSARRIEYPIGKVVYETGSGYVFDLRLSKSGRRAAFVHASYDGYALWLIEDGHSRPISGPWPGAQGLAWVPSDRELVFGAGERVMEARVTDLSGAHRRLFGSLGDINVLDVQDSRLLVRRRSYQGLIHVSTGSTEQDLAWLDYSVLVEMSRDGRLVLFVEMGEGGGGLAGNAHLFGAGRGTIYTRSTDGSSLTRIGTGRPYALSADGRWIAAQVGQPDVMNVLPTGLGTPRTVELHGLLPTWAYFSLDGSALIVYGREKGGGSRFYVLPLKGGAPRALTPTGVQGTIALSPDGRSIAAVQPDGQLAAHSLAGGDVRALPSLQPGELPIQWSSDGRALFVGTLIGKSCDVHRLDLQTGQRSLWRRLVLADSVGEAGINDVYITPDGRTCCYGAHRRLDELHLIEGVL